MTLYDVLDIADDERRLQKYLEGYGIVVKPPVQCPKCGAKLKACTYRGKAGKVCTAQGCRARVSAVSNGLLEGGVHFRSVDHNSGEFMRKETFRGRLRVVSSQGIDGTWGNLKNWLRSKGGISDDHILGYIKEFQWRRNIAGADPFVVLCQHIKDGFFQ